MTEMTGLLGPDFMIIGAMKAGTSTLYDQLTRQPGIFMTTPKEPAFFADDTVYARGAAWYESLYHNAPPDALKGEASTHYTKRPMMPDTVKRIQKAQLNPKFIYVIRNPVDRALSHFLHEQSQGVMGDDIIKSFNTHEELVDFGCYAMQLRPYVDAFGLESILLTSLEQMKADPSGQFAKIGVHIGAGNKLVWDHQSPPQNVSAERLKRFPMHKFLIDSQISKTLRRAILPQSLRQKIRATRTIGTERPTLPNDLKRRVEARFLEDRSELAALFPDHPALDLCYPFAAP